MTATVTVADRPVLFPPGDPAVEQLLAQRRAIGADHRDEVWEGVYHVAPQADLDHASVAVEVFVALLPRARALGLFGVGEFTLGLGPADYRVPDGGWFPERQSGVYAATALVLLEVLSPGDMTYAKFPFYRRMDVHEVLVADPQTQRVECWARDGIDPDAPPRWNTGWARIAHSSVFGVTMDDLGAEVDWP